MNNRRSDEVVCDCVHAFAELEIFLSDVPDRNDLGKKSYFFKKTAVLHNICTGTGHCASQDLC